MVLLWQFDTRADPGPHHVCHRRKTMVRISSHLLSHYRARASAVMSTEGRPGLMQGAHERGGIPRGWLGITYIKHDSDPHADRCEQNESGCHMPPGRLQATSAVRIANVNVESEGEESAAQPQRQSSGFTRHRRHTALVPHADIEWQTAGRTHSPSPCRPRSFFIRLLPCSVYFASVQCGHF